MGGPDRSVTFIVRLVQSGTGAVRGTVERVKTGRKEPVHGVEDVARVIAAMVRDDEATAG